ncbi:unnamed protein product [Phaedon cochleariae]|uniref:NACHT domain-containing protein n=1 Tax=Phaedon cochleariae TaxID=80249 RepID=A0A9N9SFL4_PHACE|nr:unnamed protein product [Phaedon cochleariae]
MLPIVVCWACPCTVHKMQERSGTDYQLKVFGLIALEAISLQDEKWELSTENENAGKFDDVVFESGDGGIDILIQCKHKKGMKESKALVLDWKTLLPEYYNSYKMKICKSFKRKLLMILCSNIGPSDGDFLEPKKIAIVPGTNKSYQFKSSKIQEIQKILNAFDDHSLKFCEEFRFLHIDDSAIEDGIENKVEEAQKIFGLRFSKLHFKEKIDELLQGKLQKERRIKKSHVIAFLYDSRSQDYLEKLDSFEIDFKELYAFGGNQIINIVSNYHFLNILKIHRSLLRVHSPSKNDQLYKKDQLLFIDPSVGSEILDKIIASFELPVYCILVVSLRNSDQFRIIQSRINDILNRQQYKKVIILSEVPIQDDVIQDEIKFTDLIEACQTALLSKAVNFQGKDLPIKELMINSLNNIDFIIDQATIINLINDENITIGTAIRDLGAIENYYIERKFQTEIKVQDEKTKIEEKTKIIKHRKKEFTEQDVCNFVGQHGKFVLISDGAGKGKTTVLTKLGYLIKKIYPSSFLIRIDLNMFTSIFKEFQTASKKSINLEEILQSKDKNYFKNSLEQNIFSNTKNIILMVDAVDEISPDYTSLVNNFMLQTSERKNISKIFVTTRPHLTKDLESFLKTRSYRLLPYSELEQTDFLMKYWKQNLIIDDDEKLTKCEIYAETLISKLGNSIGYTSWNFIGIPLQTRMIAEIFQGSDDKKYQWVCCKDFLLSENKTLELPDKINITELYDMFVEKKRDIFIGDKCDTQGNVILKEAVLKQYEDAKNEHQKLAARLLLNDHQYSLMNVSRTVNNISKETIIKMGMLQEIGDELLFVHQTFAEYFLAKAMWVQLKEIAERNKFVIFLLKDLFIDTKFEMIRAFLEGILTNEYSQIPMRVFEICGSTFDSITWDHYNKMNILDVIKFTDLTEACQTALLSNEVNFQGKDLPIKELVNNSLNNIDFIIAQNTIIDLIYGKNIEIGTAIRDLGEIEQYYIERKFETEIKVPDEKNKTEEKKEIIKHKKKGFTEQDVCNFVGQPGKFVLISDRAGMGKTTILTKLGCLIKETYPSSFLIRVDLNEFTSIFKEFRKASKQSMNLEEILQSKDKNYFKNSLEQNVFSNTKNIILMVDAVDEISPDYTSLVNNFMLQTSERTNISKIFVTTRPHLTRNLESFLKTESYQLLPYSNLEQTDFLMKYWKKNLTIDDNEKLTKCEIYAKTLISKLEDSIGNTSWNFIGIPLQTRMIAEIFQGSDDKKYQWVCCKDFLLSENETLELPDEINITELYDMFVEKKKDIFIEDKCDTQGNVKAKEIISKNYEDYINEHQKLAAGLLLNDHQYSLMNVSKYVNNSSKETIIGMGMLQEIGDELLFVHQTFAEYFLAKAMWVQLKEIEKCNEFLIFLLEDVFTKWTYEKIRAFFEGILTNEYSQIPMKVFEICGFTFDSITWDVYKNINILAREGRKNIVKLILEKRRSGTDYQLKVFGLIALQAISLQDEKWELSTENENAGKFDDVVFESGDGGIDILIQCKHKKLKSEGKKKSKDPVLDWKTLLPEYYNSYKMKISERRKIELVKYLVSRGATINVADKKGYTPFHLSVKENSTELFSYFIENGADVKTKAEGGTPLHCAVKNQNFEMVQELTRWGVNIHERNYYEETALHLAANVGNVNILKHLLEVGARVNHLLEVGARVNVLEKKTKKIKVIHLVDVVLISRIGLVKHLFIGQHLRVIWIV